MSSPSAMTFAAVAAVVLSTSVAAHAIDTNPSTAQIGLTRGASNFLWAVFAIMLISDLVFIGWHTRLRRGQRVFHQLPIIILTTATIAYFSMASNLGNTPIRTEFDSGHPTRTIWYVRYIDWVITTPLLLLMLLLGTGLALSDITVVIFMDLAMIITRLVGALVATSYKWGYFTLGMFALFYVLWVLMGPARATAGLLGLDHRAAFTRSAIYLSLIWLLYPICWGLADGSNTIGVTGEMIFYGVLDILAKPVFCFMHVMALRKIPVESFGFNNIHSGLNNGSHNGALAHEEKRGGPRSVHNNNGIQNTNESGGGMLNQNAGGTAGTTNGTGVGSRGVGTNTATV